MKLSGYSFHLHVTNPKDKVRFRTVFIVPSLKSFFKFLKRTLFSRSFLDSIYRTLKNDVPNPALDNDSDLYDATVILLLEKRICQYGITGKPAEVALYYTLGKDKQKIAEIMHITENTVVQHLSTIREILELTKNEEIPEFLKKV